MTGTKTAWSHLFALADPGAVHGLLVLLLVNVGALVGLVALRRFERADERKAGAAPLIFLTLSLLLDAGRLGLMLTGQGSTMIAHTSRLLGTIFVALGLVTALFQVLFDIVPARLGRRGLPPIYQEIFTLVAVVLILIGAMGEAGLKNVTSLITASAVLTAVIGLALQSTLTNVFAGLSLQMDRAFSVGDWIQVGARIGRIVEIRWRSTALRTKDGDMVMVPNSRLLVEDVHNFSQPSPQHRIWLKVSFHYRHPPNEVRDALVAGIKGTPGVLATPAPDCFPVDFGDSAVIYTVRFWIDDYARSADIEGEVRVRIWYAARRAGLEIPFPTRTLHMHSDDAGQRDAAAKAERKQRLAVIERVDLFAPLDPADHERLADGMRRATFAAGEAIIEQGEPGDSLFIIARGQVRVSLAHGAAHRDLATLDAGDFFGEMSLLTGEPRAATCWAVGDVECFVVGHEAMRRILIASPHVAEEISSVLETRQAAVDKGGAELAAAAERHGGQSPGMLARIRKFFELGA